jgi:hypothetical protein
MSMHTDVTLELAHAQIRSSARVKYLAIVDDRVNGGGDPEMSIDDVETVIRQVIEEPSNGWAFHLILARTHLPPWVKREELRVPAIRKSLAPAESEVGNG